MTLATPLKTERALRVGSVSYLNARPLIYGLDEAADVDLHLEVPSRLLDGLRHRRFDVALLPVIDYQKLEGLRIVPAGGIGSNGPALTVRIFSRMPIGKITTLACDTDSHTSVALARVILAEQFQICPRFVDLTDDTSRDAEAILLIGDKVVCEEPIGYEHQLDLGGAWKELTGLPFVFAAWMAREDADLGDLPRRLEKAKRDGLNNLASIITRYALPRGWPRALAEQYLSEILLYDIGPQQLQAIHLFHDLAAKHGLLAATRPLEVY